MSESSVSSVCILLRLYFVVLVLKVVELPFFIGRLTLTDVYKRQLIHASAERRLGRQSLKAPEGDRKVCLLYTSINQFLLPPKGYVEKVDNNGNHYYEPAK